MQIRIDVHSTVPPSRQLIEQVLDRLAQGELSPGDKLPSVREMAAHALLNPNTVSKAYLELKALGVCEARNGSGVFISEEGLARAARERLATTLETYRRAARDALRCGHGVPALLRELERLVERIERKGA